MSELISARVVHFSDVQTDKVIAEGSKGASMQWLISKDHDAPNFALRRIFLEPDGNTPFHKHEWEHEVYVLEGTGIVHIDGIEYKLIPGTSVFVPPMAEHNFKTEVGLVFLCIVPNS